MADKNEKVLVVDDEPSIRKVLQTLLEVDGYKVETASSGKEALERRFTKIKIDKVNQKFERWGFGAVAIPALLPPPFPIVPALLAAGAMQYPRKNFLAALAVGRGIRYTIVGFLGARFGPPLVAFFSRYYKPALFTLIGMAVVSGIFAIFEYLRFRKRSEQLPRKPAKPVRGRTAA